MFVQCAVLQGFSFMFCAVHPFYVFDENKLQDWSSTRSKSRQISKSWLLCRKVCYFSLQNVEPLLMLLPGCADLHRFHEW